LARIIIGCSSSIGLTKIDGRIGWAPSSVRGNCADPAAEFTAYVTTTTSSRFRCCWTLPQIAATTLLV
jgi:hypothetical protein